jgi:arsenate reductase (thioredoxin)
MLPFEWFALFRCCVFYAGGARELLFALQERMPFRGKGYQPSDLNPLANQVMKEVGIDTPAQRPRSVAPTVKERFGCVIAICDTTKERSPIFPFTLHLQHWSILNPSNTAGLPDQKTEVFRRVREEIEDKVDNS